MDERSRYRGSLLGLAAGDALGAPVEGRPPGSFRPITDMSGGGGLRPGQWTDDTSLALCLAESLVERRGFDPADQMSRYLRWLREGHLSSGGPGFGIGRTTLTALTRFERTGEPYAGPTDAWSAGNGSLMRLAPVPLFFAARPRDAIERAADSSRTTHGVAAAVDACRYFAGLIAGAVHGVDKAELLSERWSPVHGLWDEAPLAPEIDEVARGSFKEREPPEVQGVGHVVRTLEAALWAFDRSASFEEGVLRAVNLGHDADTTAAVYGQLAGAYYGEDAIPERWRTALLQRNVIESLAERLYEMRV